MAAKLKLLMVVILIFVLGITGAMAQPRNIKGTVYNSDGLPASGVKVTAHRPNSSFFTSFDGTYQLSVNSKSKYLIFTFSDREERLNIEGKTGNVIDFGRKADGEAIKIKTEKDKIKQANDCYELALGFYTKKNYPKVRDYARQAISLNPVWGKPYLLVGKTYAESAKSIGESDLQQRIVYCLAVDQFIKAKEVDPEVTDEASREITAYSQYFPGKEDAAFENIKAGSSYKIGGWINESTIVRLR
jgi:hypothetical protein